MKSFLPCLVVVLAAVPLYAAPMKPQNMTYYMENVGSYQGKCSRRWTLPVTGGYKYELVSNGRAVGGNCSTTVVLQKSSKCVDKICVRVDEWTLDADVMNITFTGEKETIMMKYGDEKMTATCFEGITVEIQVLETKTYTMKWADGKVPDKPYSFKFALYPECPGYPKGLVEASNKDSMDFSKADELEAAGTMNIVYGVIVAIIICCMFLVLLLITYCYYKNNPQGRKRRNQPKTSKLEETFSKEKKTMGEQVAKDKRVEGHYKKTDDSELQPLVSSAAPAAAAVVTQDDHGSPTIKINEEPAEKEEKEEKGEE
ncbi:uncharacterized protein LOC133195534 [Saccostrea echinata]|uniref:uncharacterized protein LOC133195534 n=1 Tax=Saccostrea echinata TaxID=191078 RepID=UPI002A7FC073|nr:uncharacterized protein LOC133195534 [Saccostrea echinata]XP_061187390.1 uncharacterized protein LOC133195534 [Saccostrea echinata]